MTVTTLESMLLQVRIITYLCSVSHTDMLPAVAAKMRSALLDPEEYERFESFCTARGTRRALLRLSSFVASWPASRLPPRAAVQRCYSRKSELIKLRTECRPPMNYKFSGHETFPCRYAWLPKAHRE